MCYGPFSGGLVWSFYGWLLILLEILYFETRVQKAGKIIASLLSRELPGNRLPGKEAGNERFFKINLQEFPIIKAYMSN